MSEGICQGEVCVGGTTPETDVGQRTGPQRMAEKCKCRSVEIYK